MKKLLLIASLFMIAGLATGGMVVNQYNPLPSQNNPVPPCLPTGCKPDSGK